MKLELTKERMVEMARKLAGMEFCPDMMAFYGEVLRLVEADADGRLVILPCKVGDVLYMVIQQRDNFDDVPYEIVTAVCFNYNMIDKIGKTVFLTREEAEAALKKMGGGDNA